MNRIFRSKRRGFTLVEIMVVVSIVGLLVALAMPNLLRARKRSQGQNVLQDLKQIDSATDQYALENVISASTVLTFTQIKIFLKPGTRLEASSGKDIFGNSYGTYTVDSYPRVPAVTFADLSTVCPPSFWSPFATP